MTVWVSGHSNVSLSLLFNTDLNSQHTVSVESSSQQVLTGRMRKRDIVRYYGKRMIRKVLLHCDMKVEMQHPKGD